MTPNTELGARPFARHWLIAAAILLLTIPGVVLADRIADDTSWTGAVGNATTGGGNANAVINGGSGMSVNVTTAANNFIGIGNNGTLGSSLNASEAGINPAWYTPNMNPTATRFGFNISLSGATTYSGAFATAGDPACSQTAAFPVTPIGTTITCHGTGSTVTITFEHPVTDPVLHISRLGGNTNNPISGNFFNIWSNFTLTSGGSLSLLSGNGQLAVVGNTITHAPVPTGQMIGSFTSGQALCGPAASGVPTACGSVKVTGTFTKLTFDTSLSSQRVAGTIPQELIIPGNSFADASHWMLTVPEDFGDAPSSYDPAVDASHILSDLRLGPAATIDTPAPIINTANAASPYVGAAMPNPTASGDGNDDGVTMPAKISDVQGTVTVIPVTLSGASKAGTACGWIDFDRSGTFTAAEGVCQSFGIGATGLNLTFTTPAGAGFGDTVARFRVTYDTMTAATFTGLLDSGEVEDYVTLLVPTLRLKKELPNGRFAAGDQFQLSINSTPVTTVTTTGSGTTATEEALVNPPVPGTSYALSELGAAGADLANYVTTYTCSNANTTSATVMPSGSGTTIPAVVPGAGDDITCKFVNTAKAKLTVVKRVTNDSGGTKTVTDFNVTTSGGALTFGTPTGAAPTLIYTSNALAVNPGTYTLVEANVAGYAEGTWSCTGAAGAVTPAFGAGSVVVAAGENVVCTITNDDQAVPLTLRKQWVNANLGDDATVTVSRAGTVIDTLVSNADAASELDTDATPVSVLPGDVLELAEVLPGTNAGAYNGVPTCTGTTGLSGTTLTVGAADTAIVCTYTNTHKVTDLSITKTNTPGSGPLDQLADTLVSGATTTYTLVVKNNGTEGVTGAILADPAGSRTGLTCTTPPTCSSSAATGCPVPAMTLGQLEAGVALTLLPPGASVTVTLTCTVQ